MSSLNEQRWIETEYVSSSHTTSASMAFPGEEGDGENADVASDSGDEGPGLFTSMFADTELETTAHSFPNPFFGHSAEVDPSSSSSSLTVKLKALHPSTGQTLSSTGLTLWRAAPQLCEYLTTNASTFISNKRVLELGSGVGLVGILASYLKPGEVYLTDGDTDTLKGMRANISLNSSSSNANDTNIHSHQLIWSDEGSKTFLGDHGTFDTILGSDIIYVPEVIVPLFQTVDRLLKPYCEEMDASQTTADDAGLGMILPRQQPAFVLSYARRNVKIDLVQEEARRRGFKVIVPEGSEGCWVFERQAPPTIEGELLVKT